MLKLNETKQSRHMPNFVKVINLCVSNFLPHFLPFSSSINRINYDLFCNSLIMDFTHIETKIDKLPLSLLRLYSLHRTRRDECEVRFDVKGEEFEKKGKLKRVQVSGFSSLHNLVSFIKPPRKFRPIHSAFVDFPALIFSTISHH